MTLKELLSKVYFDVVASFIAKQYPEMAFDGMRKAMNIKFFYNSTANVRRNA